MKFGLISDVHGDVEALDSALKLLRTQGVDRILCAGDLVERGGDGDAAVARVRRERILTVAGNHDRAAVHHQTWFRRNARHFEVDLQDRILADETIAFLQKLEDIMLVTAGEQYILLAHGTPWSNTLYLFPGTPQKVFQRVAQAAAHYGASAVVLGHTHMPMLSHTDDVWILNPGSICGTFAAGSRTFGLLTLPEFSFEVYAIDTGQTVRVARPAHEYLE